MKKILIFASFIVVFIISVIPSIPAIQNQVINKSFNDKIIEIIENEDYKELKELLDLDCDC